MSRWRWMCSLRLAIEWAGAVNAELTRLYWTVGQRLAADVLGGERAQYGSHLLDLLGQRLSQEFGRGFEARILRRMVIDGEDFYLDLLFFHRHSRTLSSQKSSDRRY